MRQYTYAHPTPFLRYTPELAAARSARYQWTGACCSALAYCSRRQTRSACGLPSAAEVVAAARHGRRPVDEVEVVAGAPAAEVGGVARRPRP